MATPTQQATQQLNPVYNSAAGAIQGQIPAVQQLYASLLQGLQQQQANQYGNIVNSAAQRGVSSQGINSGAQYALGQALAQQGAQLGVQQAQDISGLQQAVGTVGVNRVGGIQSLSNSLNNQSLDAQKNKLALQQLQQNAALEMQKNQQQYNVQAANYATQQARSAARAAQSAANFDPTTVSERTVTLAMKESLASKAGKDGHVSPTDLAIAYNKWTKYYGLTPQSFWQNYQGYWDSPSKNSKGSNWQGNAKDYGTVFHHAVETNKGL